MRAGNADETAESRVRSSPRSCVSSPRMTSGRSARAWAMPGRMRMSPRRVDRGWRPRAGHRAASASSDKAPRPSPAARPPCRKSGPAFVQGRAEPCEMIAQHRRKACAGAVQHAFTAATFRRTSPFRRHQPAAKAAGAPVDGDEGGCCGGGGRCHGVSNHTPWANVASTQHS